MFSSARGKAGRNTTRRVTMRSPRLLSIIARRRGRALVSRVRLLSNTTTRFSRRGIGGNRLSPIFFKSTLAGFNMRAFLRRFLDVADSPLPEGDSTNAVSPVARSFSKFMFGVRTGVGGGRHSHVTFVQVYSKGFSTSQRMCRIRKGGGVHLLRPRRVVTSSHRMISRTCTKSVVNVFSPNVFTVNSAVYAPKGGFTCRKVPAFTPRRFTHITLLSSVGEGRFIGKVGRVTRRNTVRVFRRTGNNVRRVVMNMMNILRFSILGCHLRGRCGIRVHLSVLPCRCVH